MDTGQVICKEYRQKIRQRINTYLLLEYLKSASIPSMTDIPDRFCFCLYKMPAAARTVAPLQAHLGCREAYLPVWYASNV